MPDDYAPPYPAWVARHRPAVTQVAMAYFGVQYRGQEFEPKARAATARLADECRSRGGAGHRDIAHYVDEAGYDTLIVIAYWDDPAGLNRWLVSADMQAWWNAPQRELDGIGHFREIFCPRVERYETLFSTPDRFEGIAVLADHLSGEIQEHAYWGGARDRIPLSQTDPLKPGGQPSISAGTASPGRRLRIAPAENLALIRSGQEWTETEGRERDLYLKEMEPVLREGMNYLRDQGRPIGCYSNRCTTR